MSKTFYFDSRWTLRRSYSNGTWRAWLPSYPIRPRTKAALGVRVLQTSLPWPSVLKSTRPPECCIGNYSLSLSFGRIVWPQKDSSQINSSALLSRRRYKSQRCLRVERGRDLVGSSRTPDRRCDFQLGSSICTHRTQPRLEITT